MSRSRSPSASAPVFGSTPSCSDACDSVLSIMSERAAQASLQQIDRAGPDGSSLVAQPLQRRARRRQRIAQLVRDEARGAPSSAGPLLIAALDVLRERVRDSRVEPLRDHLLLVQADLAPASRAISRMHSCSRPYSRTTSATSKCRRRRWAPCSSALPLVLGSATRRVQRRDDLVDERGNLVEQLGVSSAARSPPRESSRSSTRPAARVSP
jgi:hypothetical protein